MPQAGLMRFNDILQKHNAFAPLDGVVTNLRCGSARPWCRACRTPTGSIIMTIADMSLITSEVKVDETDIVNVKLDQPADITIDAIPNKTFKGHVIEIGNTAILRSTAWRPAKARFPARKPRTSRSSSPWITPPKKFGPDFLAPQR